MATDEEIEEQRAVVETLREELEERRRDRAERERDAANEITLTNLQAEEARLRAQMAQEDWDTKRTSGEGAASPVNAAKEDMERAAHLQKVTAEQLTAKPAEPVEEGSTPTPAPAPAPAPVSPIPAPSKTQKGAK